MDTEGQKLYTFIELPVFMRQLETLASFETLYSIQSDLLEDPERWPEHRGRIFLLLLFSKNEQANLSADQIKQVAAVVEKIKGANKQENP
jgi:hypothetical protein